MIRLVTGKDLFDEELREPRSTKITLLGWIYPMVFGLPIPKTPDKENEPLSFIVEHVAAAYYDYVKNQFPLDDYELETLTRAYQYELVPAHVFVISEMTGMMMKQATNFKRILEKVPDEMFRELGTNREEMIKKLDNRPYYEKVFIFLRAFLPYIRRQFASEE